VRLVTSYCEDWGSKRMASCYWMLHFQFSGELMARCPSSARYIKSITLHSATAGGGTYHLVAPVIASPDQWRVETLLAPPWRFHMICASPSYRCFGTITDVNDHTHPFTFLVRGDNSANNPQPKYVSEREGRILSDLLELCSFLKFFVGFRIFPPYSFFLSFFFLSFFFLYSCFLLRFSCYLFAQA
jgi:hypothetical protein